MLPDVIAENGKQSLRDGVVLVRRAYDLHVSALLARQPDPSRAELLRAGIVELCLEVVEVAEGFLDRVADGAGWIASAFGLHDLPEHSVVNVASTIVADCAANVFGDGVEV